MCNTQNRISRRIEGVMEDMIYVKAAPKKEEEPPKKDNKLVEVELPF